MSFSSREYSDDAREPMVISSSSGRLHASTPRGMSNMHKTGVYRYNGDIEYKKSPNFRAKMLKVAWHPRLDAVAVAGLYKLYLYQSKSYASLPSVAQSAASAAAAAAAAAAHGTPSSLPSLPSSPVVWPPPLVSMASEGNMLLSTSLASPTGSSTTSLANGNMSNGNGNNGVLTNGRPLIIGIDDEKDGALDHNNLNMPSPSH
jgi:hypothetical protein